MRAVRALLDRPLGEAALDHGIAGRGAKATGVFDAMSARSRVPFCRS